MHRVETAALLSAALLVACSPDPKNVGLLGTDTQTGEGATDTSPDDADDDGPGGSGSVDPDGDDGTTGDEPGAVPLCAEDADGDGIVLEEDNSFWIYNPDQLDQDDDGIADVEDLCPSVAGNPFADSDRDGFGNPCDPCRDIVTSYEIDGVPDHMAVRSIPGVQDSDGDGIGDACDVCVQTADCGSFGSGNPWRPSDGDPLVDPACQADADGNGVGDACEGAQAPGSAGAVGFGPADDFDQDGLRNDEDGCPRLPADDAIACDDDTDCAPSRRCTSTGRCDHPDADGDDIGDTCDTCPVVANPQQNVEGFTQEDDPDGDFIGSACELGGEAQACSDVKSPARVGFHAVAAGGWCCTVAWDGHPILDPWGVPIDPGCSDAQAAAGECVSPPAASLAGLGQFTLPPGCDAALAAAGLTASENVPLVAADVGGLDELWPFACRKPVLDQDFDGIADKCDLCVVGFDPLNEPYVDDGGKLWPQDGKYCNGDWAVQSCEGD